MTLIFAAISSISMAEDIPTIKTADLRTLLQNATPGVSTVYSARNTAGMPASDIANPDVNWRGDEGKEMARIAALDPIDLEANGMDDGSKLREVIRAVATASGIQYRLIDCPAMDTLITENSHRHPWAILTSLCETYGLDMKYSHGIWTIFAKNDNELVVRTYQIRHNTLESFAPSGGGGGGGKGAGDQKQTSSLGSGGSSPGVSVDRSAQSIYSLDSSPIEKAVKEFLGIQGTVSANPDAAVAPIYATKGAPTSAPTGLVRFDSATNTLTVIATRAQQSLVAGWLAQIDQPQKILSIESKFLLTSVSPKSRTGLSNPFFSDSGIGLSMSSLSSEVNPSKLASWKFPTAILKVDDMQARLNIMASDASTRSVQYPTLVTISGKEVVLRSVRQEPIAASSISPNATSGTTSAVSETQYIDVGTIISILPKVMDERNIIMSISITVSSMAGTTMVNGNPTPRLVTQTYTTQAIIENGCSLALGGLEQTLQDISDNHMPYLGRLPVFGFLFKDVTKNQSRSVLTMIVTPMIVPSYSGGNTTGIAMHATPATNNAPRIVFDGSQAASAEDVRISLRGLRPELDDLRQVAVEGRGDGRAFRRIKLLTNELSLMALTLRSENAHGRGAQDLERRVTSYQSELSDISKKMKASILLD